MEHLQLDRIRAVRQIKTLCWCQRVGSTNDLALSVGRSGDLALPALFVAEEQTRGRGRGSNRWWSSSGALTVSLLIEPEAFGLAPGEWTRVALATATAVCQAIDPLLPEWLGGGRIRWPNDVYLKDRKVAGVLVESTVASEDGQLSSTRRLVVGFGLNVNNSAHAAPAELRQRAVALCDVVGTELDRTGLLVAILEQWFAAVEGLARGARSVSDFWQQRADLVGEPVEIVTPKGTLRGLCCGIDPAGQLVLHTTEGQQIVATGWNLRRVY